MIVRSARIKNFRSLKDVSLNFSRQTVLVGGNGAGKSSVLRAIELFYAPSLTYIRDVDFFDRNNPIEIQLTFTAFNVAERELFENRIVDNEMSVVRIVEPGGGKGNGRYFGMALVHPGFKEMRGQEGMQRRNAFNAIPREGIYADLPKAAKVAEVDSLVTGWESTHQDQCIHDRDDGQFFGFQNVGRGALQKATSFVLVPAVRDASADAQDSKNAPIGQLMELIVRSAIQSRKDVQEFQQRITEEYQKLTNPENLPELGGLADNISNTLRQLYSDAAVALDWQPTAAFAVPLPGAEVALEDDYIRTPVDRAGHGLQRAFIIALLQHLARARIVEQKAGDSENEENGQQQKPVETGTPLIPGLILAIEEPELYQHPTKQRHFARVLSDLSHGRLPGMATTTQMIFATHSPYFVSMDRFDEIRILRRVRPTPKTSRETVCSSADLSSIAEILERATEKPRGTITGDSLKPRLHIIGPELAEGFFAKIVVLVEGISDKAALIAGASLKGRHFEADGIAVLPVEGKDKMDKTLLIFTSLGIPVYAMWDSDKGNAGRDSERIIKANRLLQKLVSAPEPYSDYPAIIADTFACFEDKLETSLQAELGAEIFDNLIDKKVIIYGLPGREGARKNPEVMSQILKEAADQGATSAILDRIVDRIFALGGGSINPPTP